MKMGDLVKIKDPLARWQFADAAIGLVISRDEGAIKVMINGKTYTSLVRDWEVVSES